MVTEINRSRRYLERSRLLQGMEQLDVCMLAAPALAEALVRQAESSSPLKFHFIEPAGANRKLGLKLAPVDDRLEAIYVAEAFDRASDTA